MAANVSNAIKSQFSGTFWPVIGTLEGTKCSFLVIEALGTEAFDIILSQNMEVGLIFIFGRYFSKTIVQKPLWFVHFASHCVISDNWLIGC